MDLNLAGAHLINFDLSVCRVRHGTFDGALFTNDPWFSHARFARGVPPEVARYALSPNQDTSSLSPGLSPHRSAEAVGRWLPL